MGQSDPSGQYQAVLTAGACEVAGRSIECLQGIEHRCEVRSAPSMREGESGQGEQRH
jgi:hypothetical protein